MKYCVRCGAPLEENDTFCSKCGAENMSAEPKEKLLCELAYTGVLFWLPLFLGKEVKDTKYHANQGLWLLILSCLLCWGIQITGIIRNFFRSGLLAFIFNGVYAIVFIVALLALLYLAIQAAKCAFAIHKGEAPESILFFEKKAIIKER